MIEAIKKMKSHHQFLFALLIGFAVISFWRGVWGLMDVYLFPGNYSLSLWVSVILGVLILVIAGYFTKELV
jgi:uncharacterized membrane protein